MWELPNNSHLFTVANLDAMGVLINLLALYKLMQVLPPGLATLEASNTKNHTRPDNMSCLEELEHLFIQCEVKYHLRPVITDHYPIISSIDFQPEQINTSSRPNYREADWDEFNKVLAQRLNTIPPPSKITTPEQFHRTFKKIMQIIAETSNPLPIRNDGGRESSTKTTKWYNN
ncbi:hypothetical protein DEU56DRAFT_750206 [Suillus clintonianus]|uniref:uncharacterized protein n=1 Tax=Suillus clintonianus TaxID=1904413 RepID=UPI001B87D619|nr:uncharacterized protein DEU56DRAFT_750206 [Suillus clintonianus]KAG2156986.1 hypothetical protein DEU56DRAFT_750206 [Suillus clintonianus]